MIGKTVLPVPSTTTALFSPQASEEIFQLILHKELFHFGLLGRNTTLILKHTTCINQYASDYK